VGVVKIPPQVRIIVGTAIAFGALGCATVQHDPLYDGVPASDEVVAAPSDSVLLVPVTIDNSRSGNAEVINPPMFYVIGNGKHQLMRLGGPATKTRLVDSRWLESPDGRLTIVAHYGMGRPDLIYEPFPWHHGETISISLETKFNRVSAWAHR
jgi:hypothetical protein